MNENQDEYLTPAEELGRALMKALIVCIGHQIADSGDTLPPQQDEELDLRAQFAIKVDTSRIPQPTRSVVERAFYALTLPHQPPPASPPQ